MKKLRGKLISLVIFFFLFNQPAIYGAADSSDPTDIVPLILKQLLSTLSTADNAFHAMEKAFNQMDKTFIDADALIGNIQSFLDQQVPYIEGIEEQIHAFLNTASHDALHDMNLLANALGWSVVGVAVTLSVFLAFKSSGMFYQGACAVGRGAKYLKNYCFPPNDQDDLSNSLTNFSGLGPNNGSDGDNESDESDDFESV